MAEDVLYPGDFIANAEEFIPGDGTFVEDGRILASEVGAVKKDLEKRIVSIEAYMPQLQKRGLVVTGIVEKTGEKAAFIGLMPLEENNRRFIPIPASTVLRVNNIRRGFVKDLRDEFKVGDIVRVKIVDAEPQNVVVSTEGTNLGVIKAYCVKCRHALDKAEHGLICPNCGWKDNRHLAKDYREGKV